MTMLLPADLIFTHSPEDIGVLIRWFETARGEAPTYTNHTAGVGTSSNVVEAQMKVISTPYDEWKGGKDYQIWRTSDLTDQQRVEIAKYVETQIGRKYGIWKLLPHAGDGLLSKLLGGSPYVFRRLLFIDRYPVCYWIWTFGYAKQNLRFGGDPKAMNPDDMLDYINNHPLKWTMVASS